MQCKPHSILTCIRNTFSYLLAYILTVDCCRWIHGIAAVASNRIRTAQNVHKLWRAISRRLNVAVSPREERQRWPQHRTEYQLAQARWTESAQVWLNANHVEVPRTNVHRAALTLAINQQTCNSIARSSERKSARRLLRGVVGGTYHISHCPEVPYFSKLASKTVIKCKLFHHSIVMGHYSHLAWLKQIDQKVFIMQDLKHVNSGLYHSWQQGFDFQDRKLPTKKVNNRVNNCWESTNSPPKKTNLGLLPVQLRIPPTSLKWAITCLVRL